MKETRSSLDILSELIRLAGQRQKRARMMHAVHLGYDEFAKYMDFLLSKGYVTVEAETGVHDVTAAGREFLRDLDKVVRHFRPPTDDAEPE